MQQNMITGAQIECKTVQSRVVLKVCSRGWKANKLGSRVSVSERGVVMIMRETANS